MSIVPPLPADGYENVLGSQLVLEPAMQIPTATLGLDPKPVPLMDTWLLVVRPVSGVTDVSEAPPDPPLLPTAAVAGTLCDTWYAQGRATAVTRHNNRDWVASASEPADEPLEFIAGKGP